LEEHGLEWHALGVMQAEEARLHFGVIENNETRCWLKLKMPNLGMDFYERAAVKLK